VEPQSSGLGGGAFMTYYDAGHQAVTAYNGRETAPPRPPTSGSTATTAAARQGHGDPVGPLDRRAGAIAMLHLAQSQHGKLAWKDLFGEAERLADGGFPVPAAWPPRPPAARPRPRARTPSPTSPSPTGPR
jgi:gamma-glutamyltranspeptidase/glutathione hydrolase